jgi:hypothetical protein
MAMHSSIGKFLRAVEKALLVNTPWDPPSYTYVPPSQTTGEAIFGAGGSTSSASSDAGSDEDSLLPPGASTPMFSPIPFLRHPNADESPSMEVDGQGSNSRGQEEGLMSPLMLGGNSEHGANLASSDKSPKDEHAAGGASDESHPKSASPTTPAHPASSSTPVTIGPSDPGHQSYLGRVDELDTGPLAQPANSNGEKTEREDEIMTPGTGEGGNMAPHGMSDKPVPISSTTVLGDEERKIAGIPKASLGERFVKADEASASDVSK